MKDKFMRRIRKYFLTRKLCSILTMIMYTDLYFIVVDLPLSSSTIAQENAVAQAILPSCETISAPTETISFPIDTILEDGDITFATDEDIINTIGAEDLRDQLTEDTWDLRDAFIDDLGDMEGDDTHEGMQLPHVADEASAGSIALIEPPVVSLVANPNVDGVNSPASVNTENIKPGIGKRYLPKRKRRGSKKRRRRRNQNKIILSKKARIDHIIKELSSEYPRMNKNSQSYKSIAKLVINTIIKNKGDVKQYIDLTNEPDASDEDVGFSDVLRIGVNEYRCMNSECVCQLYNMEDFEDNGFCLGCLPADKFDSSYVPKIVENTVEEINLSKFSIINFGPTQERFTRYICMWNELPDISDTKYVSAILDLVENYAKLFVGARSNIGKCKTNSKDNIFRDAAVILSIPNGVAQSRHTDHESADQGLSILVALQDDTALDVIRRSHRSFQWINQFEENVFTQVAIPKHHFIMFSGGLHHRGISYKAKNVRLHSYVDFIGNTRKPNTVYNTTEVEVLQMKRELARKNGETVNVTARRISRVLPSLRKFRTEK